MNLDDDMLIYVSKGLHFVAIAMLCLLFGAVLGI